jgi:hypothetical protein
MRLTVKRRDYIDTLVNEFLAKGGTIKKEDAQTATKRMKRQLSLGSRHLGKHNKFGARV